MVATTINMPRQEIQMKDHHHEHDSGKSIPQQKKKCTPPTICVQWTRHTAQTTKAIQAAASLGIDERHESINARPPPAWTKKSTFTRANSDIDVCTGYGTSEESRHKSLPQCTRQQLLAVHRQSSVGRIRHNTLLQLHIKRYPRGACCRHVARQRLHPSVHLHIASMQ